MRILVVESPAKSKTIGKYLGKDYIVIPSFGHIRDLPSKNGSVNPENDFGMQWEVNETGKSCINNLKKAIKSADELLLATDPDREGEAISWHIVECLSDEIKKKDIKIKRVVFHEITKNAILDAIKSSRELDYSLIDAYLTRRALDYLFGFTLSPVLWRKLPGCKSAGRVQSVALRIIADRENEIESFKSEEYWSIKAVCLNENKKTFESKLFVLNEKKLNKFSIKNKDEAEKAKSVIESGTFHVKSVEKKVIKKNSAPPFITSTLQQEASRKFGFPAKKTMQLAQQLYEGVNVDGETKALITYMRTDSVNLSKEFVESGRSYIKELYGDKFLPNIPNKFKNKVKNAQEAHESIRPIDVNVSPDKLSGVIDAQLLKLYTLVWKRAVASQMSQAEYNQVQVEIFDAPEKNGLRATGTTIAFEGYLKVYEEGKDDTDYVEDQKLPVINEGEVVHISNVERNQHYTQPPPRYTEASLVKKMEELGIGRPSTYATVIQVLQGRKYASIKKKTFFPELKGRFVISFLKKYFPKYLEYDFTANMEEDLDDISNNNKSRNSVLENFWKPFIENAQSTKKISMIDVINQLNEDMANVIFGKLEDDKKCPMCGSQLGLKLWSTGAFVGCSKYPDCDYKRVINEDVSEGQDLKQATELSDYPKYLGNDPSTNEEIHIKPGPYGLYLERSTNGKDKKRASIPKSINPDSLSFENAIKLLSLPKEIGEVDGAIASLGIGRYGPYILHKGKFKSIKDITEFLNLDLDKVKNILMGK